MVNQMLEEKLGGCDCEVNKEHTLALRQLCEDNAAHKKEIDDLSRAINKLTKQIRELKNVQAATNKENQPPDGSPSRGREWLWSGRLD